MIRLEAMWPFSDKKQGGPKMSVTQALELLADIGVRARAQISNDDLALSLGGSLDSPVNWTLLLCVLGGEVERGDFERISDDIWHVDAECIEDHGDYVRLVQRFAILTKGLLPLNNIRDHVAVDKGEAWVEFDLEAKPSTGTWRWRTIGWLQNCILAYRNWCQSGRKRNSSSLPWARIH
ncbi:MAG TPA: hypothetical protein VHB20_14315 [Verrucomicrobiae bacterium]|jgi:hypothetical protein|nr:hypothetical protein [Verrucomicrobiae bacterium]